MVSNKFINKLQGKRVLAFGGTSGIGYAVVEGSIEYGATVIISGSNQPKLDRTVGRLKTSYPDLTDDRISTYPCDLSNADTLEANLEALLQKVTKGGTDTIDHVVFTAGDGTGIKPLSDFDASSYSKFQTLRLIAPLYLFKLLPKYMTKSSESSMTLTSGTVTRRPIPKAAQACTIGSSLEGLVRGAAVDLAPIRTNLVAPGAINTELFRSVPKQIQDMFTGKTLLKKLGRPEDIAEAYLYLMKDGFVTGSFITSDGGRLLVD